MTVKISRKIVSSEIVGQAADRSSEVPAKVVVVEESVDRQRPVELERRPEELEGSTYKIKTPLSEHALYITINDVVIRSAGNQVHRRPFEIFINSKNMENFAWIVALTRVISSVFRKGGDVTFLVEELRSVFDPRGGYFKPGGKYMPSLVAEIGECLEKHLVKIGMIRPEEPSPELQEKRQKAEDLGMSGGRQCPKCAQMTMVRLEGCDTCLECGYSKCG